MQYAWYPTEDPEQNVDDEICICWKLSNIWVIFRTYLRHIPVLLTAFKSHKSCHEAYHLLIKTGIGGMKLGRATQ